MQDNQLSILANLCQLFSFVMLLNEVTNKDLLQELKVQDKILEEQTESYLKEILNRLIKIENFLKKKGINLNEN